MCCLDFARQRFRAHPQTRQQRRHDAVMLGDQRAEQVQRLDLLIVVPRGDILRRLHGFLSFECEFVETDHGGAPHVINAT